MHGQTRLANSSSQPVNFPGSLYLSRQDLGLAKKTIEEITTSITMSQKTIEATG